MQKKQAGMVMIIGLVMMLLLTIIGLAAMRGTSMQELMTSNLKDHNLAFQAAEAALRDAEAKIDLAAVCSGGYTNANGCYTDQGVLGTPVSGWTNDQWSANSKEADVTLNLPTKPRFVIEKLTLTGSSASVSTECVEFGCATGGSSQVFYYRITSLGYGGTITSGAVSATQVMLQSMYQHN